MSYDLSVFLGGIRKENWQKLYDSIITSIGNYTWEFILCGPYSPPDDLLSQSNVTWIEDWGCPTRAYQRAAIACTGRWLTWGADDGWFYKGMLKKYLTYLENDKNTNNKTVLVFKYIEGGNNYPDESFYLHFHENCRLPTYPNTYVLFNLPIMKTNYFKELGGFDCRFEACPMAFVDFGVRTQRDSSDVRMIFENIFECTQIPGPVGDHIPIHYGQIEHDQPFYTQMYQNPQSINRIKIDINNWKQVPSKWLRRFN